MFEFDEPPPFMLKPPMQGGQQPPSFPYYFGKNYLVEVIFARPYWRSSDEAAAQAEEVIEQIDSGARTYVVRGKTLEALQNDMKLAGEMVQNSLLVRPSLRSLRIVNNAREHDESRPEPQPVKDQPANGQ